MSCTWGVREREAWVIQDRALVLSARRWRIHPPGGEGRWARRETPSQVLMNTATNSRTLMWSLPVGWGPYRGGSDVSTGQPRVRRSADEIRHLKGGVLHHPPRPS